MADMSEGDLIRYCAVGMVLVGLPTVLALLSGQRAAYGRYFTDNDGVYLFNMNGKLAWVLQVCWWLLWPTPTR
jgi:hypothetical protein